MRKFNERNECVDVSSITNFGNPEGRGKKSGVKRKRSKGLESIDRIVGSKTKTSMEPPTPQEQKAQDEHNRPEYTAPQCKRRSYSNCLLLPEQLIVPAGIPLPPKPPMPEPQHQPYIIDHRKGNISKCSGCDDLFDRTNPTLLVMGREEMDYYPKVNKSVLTKCWAVSNKKHYYCLQMKCLKARRPFLELNQVKKTVSCELSEEEKRMVDEEFGLKN